MLGPLGFITLTEWRKTSGHEVGYRERSAQIEHTLCPFLVSLSRDAHSVQKRSLSEQILPRFREKSLFYPKYRANFW